MATGVRETVAGSGSPVSCDQNPIHRQTCSSWLVILVNQSVNGNTCDRTDVTDSFGKVLVNHFYLFPQCGLFSHCIHFPQTEHVLSVGSFRFSSSASVFKRSCVFLSFFFFPFFSEHHLYFLFPDYSCLKGYRFVSTNISSGWDNKVEVSLQLLKIRLLVGSGA